jgi:hypothetical protein
MLSRNYGIVVDFLLAFDIFVVRVVNLLGTLLLGVPQKLALLDLLNVVKLKLDRLLACTASLCLEN